MHTDQMKTLQPHAKQTLSRGSAMSSDDDQAVIDNVMMRFDGARKRRQNWESLWQDCYDYALPQRANFNGSLIAGQSKVNDIYDATAMDAVDQLSASLLGHLTPTWSQWFGL